ncbi:glycosyl hydrolase family 92-domain-containing protein [Mycena haematopus]|nr:glycosyl hydrolase family 92-domain-containing protein [Mycena haematopus]
MGFHEGTSIESGYSAARLLVQDENLACRPLCGGCRVSGAQDPAQFVNPFIGTSNGGHVFSGATLPWGSVKAGADSLSGDNQAGYVSDGSSITGISQLQDDGTGGGASLGNFPFLPLTTAECANSDLTKCTVDNTQRAIAHGNPTASPGYFSIPLNNGVQAEVTVTHHTALHRFTYPNGTEQLLFLLDATRDLSGSYQGNGQVTVSPNPTTNGTRVTGRGTFSPSFGEGSYQVYFCFDAPTTFVQAKYYLNSGGLQYTDLDPTQTPTVRRGSHGFRPWDGGDPGCTNGYFMDEHRESVRIWGGGDPDISAFDNVQAAARATWNNVLGTVVVDNTGVSTDTQELFWSSLYRTYISPTNITGDNPLWNSTEPYYDSFYCIWDSFRVVHPLVTQGGSNADNLLSDSFVKGITAGIDWETGYEAMVKDATVEGDFSVQGRGGIAARASHGYVPECSRLLEYAYNDFGIGLVAQGLGKPADTANYFKKSGIGSISGTPTPQIPGSRDSSSPGTPMGRGTSIPDHCSPVFGHNDCFLNPSGGEFYEASSWEYSWFVPHDMARLVKAVGGPAKFSSRLDTFFSAGFHDIGDEPGFFPTYLYNYVGQPTKTVDRVDAVLTKYYNTSINGLPGNDDSGAMGAYVVWSHFGFFPVAGQDTYLLNRPYFPKITIRNEVNGAVATIIAQGLSAQNVYIQSATLNGKPYTKNWISHDLFTKGGTLKFVMGWSKNSKWGTGQADLPMSLSTGGFK